MSGSGVEHLKFCPPPQNVGQAFAAQAPIVPVINPLSEIYLRLAALPEVRIKGSHTNREKRASGFRYFLQVNQPCLRLISKGFTSSMVGSKGV